MGYVDQEYGRLLQNIALIEQRIGYAFNNKELLIQAFVHRSFLNEWNGDPLPSNERIEFLGDSVLNLFVSQFLFISFPHATEGEMSKKKAYLVSHDGCAKMSEIFDISSFVLVGKGEKKTLAETHSSLTSDLFEAIIGAIFLDGGWQAATQFLSRFEQMLLQLAQEQSQNPKTALQEFLARKGLGLPEYVVEEEQGPPHDRLFFVKVLICGRDLAHASGKTKQQAQFKAAQEALEQLQGNQQ